ncbi:hypothetical protein AB4159_16720 [Vibrio cyclitrophicus]
MKIIYIVETTEALHAVELVETISLVLKNGGYDVKVIIVGKADVKFSNHENITYSKFEGYYSLFRFLLKKRDEKFIFTTVSTRNSLPLAVCSILIKKCYFYVHNLRSWHKYNYLGLNYRTVLSCLGTIFKKIILTQTKGVIVANEKMEKYFSKYIVGNNLSLHVIPFKLMNKQTNPSFLLNERKPIRIVVPGAVDFSKKRIDIFREAFESFKLDGKADFNIILLGKLKSKVELEYCREWAASTQLNISYYEGFIDGRTFESELIDADVILGYIHPNYQDKYHQEIYGITKDSGLDAQAYSYSKPLIINKEFGACSFYLSSTLMYQSSNDLVGILNSLKTPGFLSKLSEEAQGNAHFISVEQVSEKSAKFFN